MSATIRRSDGSVWVVKATQGNAMQTRRAMRNGLGFDCEKSVADAAMWERILSWFDGEVVCYKEAPKPVAKASSAVKMMSGAQERYIRDLEAERELAERDLSGFTSGQASAYIDALRRGDYDGAGTVMGGASETY